MNLAFWVILIIAGVLSYQTPIFVARHLGQEQLLNSLWSVAWQDNTATRILFVAAYMFAGMAIWAVPTYFVFAFCHPRLGTGLRRKVFTITGFLLLPINPFVERITERYTRAKNRRDEKKGLKDLYNSKYKDNFSSFERFYQFYIWLNDGHYLNPGENYRKAFADSLDDFKDAETLLGLSQPYTASELTSRYHMLMKQVHPDIAGPNDIARRLTVARDCIRVRNGWKR